MTRSPGDAAAPVAALRRWVDHGAPTDLRLVPAALAAWLAAGWGVAQAARTVLAVLLALVAGVAVLLSAGLRGSARRSSTATTRVGTAGRGGTTGSHETTGLHGTRRTGLVFATLAAVLVLVALAGHLAVRSAGPLPELLRTRATVSAEGTVRSDPRPVQARRGGGAGSSASGQPRYAVRVALQAVTGRGTSGRARADVLVIGGERWSRVRMGEAIALRGRLAPADPGEKVVALLLPTADPDVLRPAGPVYRSAELLRQGLRTACASLAPDARGLLPGLVVGDTSGQSPDLEEAMRSTGLTHLTAVSGSNVAIVCGAALLLFGRAGVSRRWRALAAGVVLVGFVVVARPDPSVLRAAVMGAIGLLGLASSRRGRAMPALCAAVVVLVSADPWLARSYGFALSVLATAALLLLARPWADALGTLLPRAAAHAVAVPAAAQAVCAPVVVLLNPQVSLVAVPANLLVAPAVAPATVLGALATVLSPWWPAAAGCCAALGGWATQWIALVARSGASLPGATVGWPAGARGALLLAALTVLGAAVAAAVLSRASRRPEVGSTSAGGGRRTWWLGAAAVAVVLCVTALVAPRVPGLPVLRQWPPGGWTLVACDVGQGDALAVRTGPRSAIVVDTGPLPDPVDRCLRRLDVSVVDLLVVTHFHADHAGGIAGAVRGRKVRQVLVSPLQEPAGQARRTMSVLRAARIPVATAVPEESGAAGTVTWRSLWPDLATRPLERGRPGPDAGDDGTRVNDASVVLLVEASGLRLLATGDVEPGAQAGLRRVLRRDGEGVVDVLKVAHHGSARQDAELHRLLSPRLALVSVGAQNDYGHPSPETLRLLHAVGATVARTDRLGDIAVGGDPGRTGREGLWVAGRRRPAQSVTADEGAWTEGGSRSALGLLTCCRPGVGGSDRAQQAQQRRPLAEGWAGAGRARGRIGGPSGRPRRRAGAVRAPRRARGP
ncbi:MAG: ComEC/Rec2 family competence protein [Actinomycetes bacterium]